MRLFQRTNYNFFFHEDAQNRQIENLTVLFLLGSTQADTRKDTSLSGISVLTFLRKCPNFVQKWRNTKISDKVPQLLLYKNFFPR